MNIKVLFALAMREYLLKKVGRLRGRHCQARLLRAQAKRRKSGHKAYEPWGRREVTP